MTEREMEDLLWQYSERFLNEPLKQFQRQPSSVVGRADLIFEDRIGRLLVVELKRDTLERGAIMQLIDYYGMLKSRYPEKAVELMIVAGRVPPERRLACEQYDISAVEIPQKKYRDVAAEVGYVFESETRSGSLDQTVGNSGSLGRGTPSKGTSLPRAKASRAAGEPTGPRVEQQAFLHWTRTGYNLSLLNLQQFEVRPFSELIDSFERAVPSGRNARLVRNLREWTSRPAGSFLLADCQSLLRWVITSGWKDAVPHAAQLWIFLFGYPAPGWYVWNGSKYDFDSVGWIQWYDSLPH